MLKEILFIVSICMFLKAHEGHQEDRHQDGKHETAAPTEATKVVFERINEFYLKELKPIFQKKCFDCHSSQTKFPSYYMIPGIKQWIQSDIDEARDHIDLESDFPFKSHATPAEDIEAIGNEIKEGDMPPFGYRMMHSESALSEDEKEKVRGWVQLGKKLLADLPK